MISAFSLLLSFVGVTLVPLLGVAQDLPPVSEHDSHKLYLESLQIAKKDVFHSYVRLYRQQLEATPDAVVPAVEYCKFLSSSTDDESLEMEEQDEPSQLLEQCVDNLARRFPWEPKALLTRVENSWGDQSISLARQALESKVVRWPSNERARMHLLLAQRLNVNHDLVQAEVEALHALELDARLDAALILAQAAEERADKRAAVQALSRRIEYTEEPYQLLAKARRLLELGDPNAALHAIELYEAREGDYTDHKLKAEVLERLGRTREARAEYKQLDGQYQPPQVVLRLFEIDLKQGDQASAVASYEALRDADFWNDPFLGHRLRLFLKHPLAPFRLRDGLGLVALLASLGVLLALPGVLVLPVHYRGLVLRERGRAAPAPSPTTLRTAWQAGVLLLIVTWGVCYLHSPDALTSWFQDGQSWREASLTATAQQALITSGLSLLLVPLLVPRALHGLWTRGLRLDLRRLLPVLGWLLLILLCNALVAGAFGLLPRMAHASQYAMPDIVRELRRLYGPTCVVFVAVVAAPWVEEIVFRYVAFDAFERHLSGRAANRLQALLFMFAHDQWAMWPTLFAIGWYSGRLRRESGSLRASIALHTVWNGTLSLLLLTFTRG